MRTQPDPKIDRPQIERGSISTREKFGPIVGHTVGVGLFLVLIAIPGVSSAIWLTLALWSLLGVRHSLQVLTFLMLTRLLNPTVYAFGVGSTAIFYLVLLAACSRIFLGALTSKEKKFEGPLLLIIFGLYGALNAGFFSYYAVVSATKIFLFTYAACAILVGFQLTSRRRIDWTPWFFGMWLSVVILSLPTLLVRDIGYARDGEGFQGILSHPQTFAVFLAPMLCWMLGQYLFVRRRLSLLGLTLLTVVAGLIVLTRARTAVVAVVFSLVAVFVFSRRYRPLLTGVLRKPLGFALMFVVLGGLASIAPNRIFEDFLLKGSDAQTIGDAYQHSRGFLIVGALESFYSHPFVGIGFGVTFEEYFNPVYDSLTGLPISAATEKSLLPIVLLEELGVIGLILFVPVLYYLLRITVSCDALAPLLLVLGCLMVNIGEAVLFSIAGLGLYLWLLIGWAMSTALVQERPSGTARRGRSFLR